jgi:hypothetical protein
MFTMPTITMTPSDDPLDAILTSYRAEIESSEITVDTMTDHGVRVGDLESIGDCSLSPGNPSPVGRTEDGDLAYAVLEGYEYVRLTRAQAAHLAHLFAAAHAQTALGSDAQFLLDSLVDAAAPRVLFPTDSAHGQLAHTAAITEVLEHGTSRFGAPFTVSL